MKTNMTLGSLFDGSGGFPLGGLLCGVTPVWASEIEPFPIRVTTKRLPNMKHYGDISTMDGGTVEPVDIISFGSPCTDMSVAGKARRTRWESVGAVLSSHPNYQGNEVRHQWQISKIHRMGECPRRFLLKRRRRLQSRSRSGRWRHPRKRRGAYA
jgi:site-specific DNA-cytosine methylase